MRYPIYSILVLFVLGGAILSTHSSAERPSAPGNAGGQPAETAHVPAPEPSKSSPTSSQGDQQENEDELRTFVPSEKIPADSAISFPVDI